LRNEEFAGECDMVSNLAIKHSSEMDYEGHEDGAATSRG
jgi:hypothetical protein